MRKREMPVIRPIPIITKNKNFFVRIFRWITSIRKWEIREDWFYTLPDGTDIVVPRGFKFDGASIPRLLWSILSPVGLLLIPALIHDYAYKYNKLIAVKANGKRVSFKRSAGRLYWDNIFRKVSIEVNGVTLLNCLAWFFLVMFGWIAWCSHRRREKKFRQTQTKKNE